MERYNCQHIDDETAPAYRCVQIGEQRQLWLCPQCWTALLGRFVYELIHEAIADGIRRSEFCEHQMA